DTSKAAIDVVGQVLVKWPELKIEIGGHTDSRGSAQLNLRLSQERVRSVLNYLLHRYPELKLEQFVVKGYGNSKPLVPNVTPKTGVGRTGVLALVDGGRPGKTVLLRADMDALPIQEENEAPYRSQAAGKMHACGHDCHTSILLAVAKPLAAQAGTLPGRVK